MCTVVHCVVDNVYSMCAPVLYRVIGNYSHTTLVVSTLFRVDLYLFHTFVAFNLT